MADGSAMLRDAEPLTPGQLLGLPGLLRAWRTVAGEKHNLGRALSQTEVAEAIGRSRAWYQALERGARPKTLDRQLLDRLADVLHLGPDERQALVLSAIDGTISIAPSVGDHEVRHNLQQILDHQLPNPAFLTDQVWNITGYNAAMAALWPWVSEPGANLVRWALLSEEARTQYIDWTHHATEYVKLLRFASTRYPHDSELLGLITDIKADAACNELWEQDTAAVSETLDGHRHRMILPAVGYKPIEAVATLLYPASMPHYRATVITWTSDDEASGGPNGPQSAAVSTQPRADKDTGTVGISARVAGAHRLLDTAEQVVEMAGATAQRLPALSSAVGEADCMLVLARDRRTVIWANRRPDGRWGASELAAYAVLVRLPPTICTDGGKRARVEYKSLVRAALPADPKEAAQRCEQRAEEMQCRIEALEEIRRDLWEAHPQQVPYVWHPVDEI